MPRTLLCLVLLALSVPLHADETRLLRHPDIHGESIVFTYAGDLWRVPVVGGTAVRLTSHPGLELFARFSPDGTRIAFTGQYDGDEQVYVMPAAGGVPVQLTFYPAQGPLPARWGYDNQVYGWSPDGARVLFRSLRDSFGVSESRLYTVLAGGGLPTALPMPQSGAGAFSPDGSKIVYSPLFRDFRTWKRYQGGWAQHLWIFDLESGRAEQITDHPRTERDPMWIGGAVYFASDRGGRLNLYGQDLATRTTTQLTFHRDADVRWPSADPARGRIVYELDGQLHVYDVAANSTRQVPVRVPDDGVASRPERMRLGMAQVEDGGLSPGGERAVITARGDVFTVPVDKGLTRNLTNTPGTHEREAAWSADGAQIAYVSDAGGEEQVWIQPQDGGAARQLTSEHRERLYAPRWSPDGRHIAYSGKSGRIWVVEVGRGRVSEVAREALGRSGDYQWSPDGRWLAYSLARSQNLRSVYVWEARSGRAHRVSDETFTAGSPAWSPDGNYLYFLSRRDFQPQISNIEWNYAGNRNVGVYALALRKDVPHPFPPQNDEISAPGTDKNDGKDKKKPDVRIDFDGIVSRVARVPLEPDNYQGLAVTATHLLFVKAPPFYYGRDAESKPALVAYSIKDRKSEELATDVRGWSLSSDGSAVLVRHERELKVYGVGKKAEPKTAALNGLMVDRVPAQEWSAVFDQVWRRFRDFFYVGNLHGHDWDAIGQQYRRLLPHVGHRSDLNFVIGEMIGELNVSHAYISGGDLRLPGRPMVALPGARFELDERAGRYRIARIFAGQNEEDRYRSPLTEVGVGVQAGDYVLAINGRQLTAERNPYELLRLPSDAPVELLVNRRPQPDGARRVLFQPLKTENDLLYLAWVRGNMRKVAEATDGRVGYLHLPDMGANGIREFIKWYYPQMGKEGLIIDVRANGGGNVSRMLIERLRRELLAVTWARNFDVPLTYPDNVFTGPMVALLNETSASDGDIFPHMFREAGLGPLIGKRSWGGVIGITNHGQLLDGGTVNVPEFGFASPAGEWIIEGHGVEPDIEVENDPARVAAGRDPQLERGIREVLERLQDWPPAPVRPADPDRSGP